MVWPTDFAIVCVRQLGRSLRFHLEKDYATVIDFGLHTYELQYKRQYRSHSCIKQMLFKGGCLRASLLVEDEGSTINDHTFKDGKSDWVVFVTYEKAVHLFVKQEDGEGADHHCLGATQPRKEDISEELIATKEGTKVPVLRIPMLLDRPVDSETYRYLRTDARCPL